jgi:hypothetical protein
MITFIGSAIGLVPGMIGSNLLDSWIRNIYGVDISLVDLSFEIFLLCYGSLFLLVVLFSLLPGWRSTSTRIQDGLKMGSNR